MELGDNNLKLYLPISIRHLVGELPQKNNPFLGRSYYNEKSRIGTFPNWNKEQQQEFVFQNIKHNVELAYSKIPLYRDLYKRNRFDPSFLKTFSDLQSIPPINKSDFLAYPIEQRCCKIEGALKVNTGGSSGHTLAFYRDESGKKNHELIHMTTIWEKLGYKNGDLKLVLSGQSTVNNGMDFCFRSNSIRLDSYKGLDQMAPKLKKIAKLTPVRYLHGYPSTIYEFAMFCDAHDHELRDLLRESLKGAFLGSEYPHPLFRDRIENIFGIDTVNWYGHSEGAVLAYEKQEKFRFYPFQTYGFAEITHEGHLLASNYYDKATPFIRYDTEDYISEPEIENGFLVSFGIKEGRSGEFVTDNNGKKISLTGLIFGRHHKLFDYCSHIQIYQKEKGKAIILYVPKDRNSWFEPGPLFDNSNILMDFTFKRLNYPIKTSGGKLNLLIQQNSF